jgi:hypothetical protein
MFCRVRNCLRGTKSRPLWPRLWLAVAGLVGCLEIMAAAHGATINVSMGVCDSALVNGTTFWCPHYSGTCTLTNKQPDTVDGYLGTNYQGTTHTFTSLGGGSYSYLFCGDGSGAIRKAQGSGPYSCAVYLYDTTDFGYVATASANWNP